MIDFQVDNLSQSLISYAQFIRPKRAVRITQLNLGANADEFIISYCTFTGTQIFIGTRKCLSQMV